MRNVTAVALALLVSGCLPEFSSVDEACKDNDVPGAGNAIPEGIAFMNELSCFRRFVGVSAARMDSFVDESAQTHARYLEANVLGARQEVFINPFVEVPGLPWYRGQNVFDRTEEAGYPLDNSTLIWEVFLPIDPDLPRADNVAALLEDPFVRDPLLAPGWRVAGYGEAVDSLSGRTYMYFNALLFLPSGSRATNPVTYPQDGQTGLPASWSASGYFTPPFDTIPQELGTPVTFTLGSASITGLADDNPLAVVLNDSAFTGPDGPIEHVAVMPGLHSRGANNSTVILLPLAPLEPGTEYTATADLTWISQPQKTVSVTFTTEGAGDGGDTASAARGARTGPVLQHASYFP